MAGAAAPGELPLTATERFAAGVLAVSACAHPLPRQPRPDLGAAVLARALLGDSAYARAVATRFTMISTENAFKFEPLRPSRDGYDFTDTDAIVAFAEAHGLRVRGHTLVWKRQLPRWLTEGRFSRDELVAILRDHILTVVGRYRGRVRIWDVVNEAISDSLHPGESRLRPTLWLDGIGPEYIELAFRFAHEADPGARLFYNDAGAEELGPKSDAVYGLLADLKGRGVPVHGVGLQMHTSVTAPPDTVALAHNIRRLAALGLEVQITEMDVGMAKAAGGEAERLAAQARVYREVLATCMSVPACTALVTWGVGDRYTWRYPDTPLLLDSAFEPKPAYREIRRLLR